MTLSIAILLLVVTVVVGAVCLGTSLGRQAESRTRRAASIAEALSRIDAAISSIGNVAAGEIEHGVGPWPPPPETGDGLPGRAALLHAVAAEVSCARREGRRLSAAVVRAVAAGPEELAAEARRHLVAAMHIDVYAVGPSAIALVLPGFGRADALGVLARIEAHCPSHGKAVELEPGESPVELAVRLLAREAAA